MRLVLGEENPAELEAAVHLSRNIVDRPQKFRQCLKRERGALEGDDELVGGSKTVHVQKIEGRRAVEEHYIERVGHRPKEAGKDLLAVHARDELLLGVGEFAVGWDQVNAGDRGGMGCFPRWQLGPKQKVGERRMNGLRVEARTRCPWPA